MRSPVQPLHPCSVGSIDSLGITYRRPTNVCSNPMIRMVVNTTTGISMYHGSCRRPSSPRLFFLRPASRSSSWRSSARLLSTRELSFESVTKENSTSYIGNPKQTFIRLTSTTLATLAVVHTKTPRFISETGRRVHPVDHIKKPSTTARGIP